jgi:hypothetical protein
MTTLVGAWRRIILHARDTTELELFDDLATNVQFNVGKKKTS